MLIRFILMILYILSSPCIAAWVLLPCTIPFSHSCRERRRPTTTTTRRLFGASKHHPDDNDTGGGGVDMDSLLDMDIVIFSRQSSPDIFELGAIQENLTIAPLSTWTNEPVFGTMLEFVVDIDDRFVPGLTVEDDDDDTVLAVATNNCYHKNLYPMDHDKSMVVRVLVIHMERKVNCCIM